MPRPGLPLCLVLLAAPAALAQPPAAGDRVPVPGAGGPPAAPAAPDPALVAHLDGWEKAIRGTTNFYSECNITKRQVILNKESESAGKVACLKPNLAWMRIDRKLAPGTKEKGAADDYQTYICNGTTVFEYDGSSKTLTEHPLPDGGVGDNLLLAFISGVMSAKDVQRRFDMKLLKEDANYVYLDVRSRLPMDRAEFDTMTLVLFGPQMRELAYLPRTVVMRKLNGQEEEVWNFPRPMTNVQGLAPANFQKVPPPPDWKVRRAAAPPAGPRVRSSTP